MLHFDVEFYQEQRNKRGDIPGYRRNHKILFQTQITNKSVITDQTLDSLETNGFFLNEFDFIHYALFKHQNDNRFGSRNNQEIAESAFSRIPDFSRFYDFGSSVQNHLNNTQGGNDRMYAEYHGVAGALTTNNHLFGLTNADYKVIPEHGGLVMDHSLFLGSNGVNNILIESKGTFGLKNSHSESSRSIIEKKQENDYTNQANDLYYGVITKVPYADENGNAKCIIVDPPIDGIGVDPKRFKLHTRINYYSNRFYWFQRGAFQDLFEDLLNILESSNENWEKEFEHRVEKKEFNPRERIGFISYRSTTINVNSDIRGSIMLYKLDENRFFIFGFVRELIYALINPKIDDILSLNFSSIAKDYFVENINPSRRLVEDLDVSLNGKITVNSAGEIWGILEMV
jgi:hypothetical protein